MENTAKETAKRGDLVLIEETRDYGSKEPEWTIERVTSVSDGYPRITSHYMFGNESEQPLFRWAWSRDFKYKQWRVYYKSHLLIPATDVDVEELWAAWLARYESYQVPPFKSVDEARAFCSPFRLSMRKAA